MLHRIIRIQKYFHVSMTVHLLQITINVGYTKCIIVSYWCGHIFKKLFSSSEGRPYVLFLTISQFRHRPILLPSYLLGGLLVGKEYIATMEKYSPSSNFECKWMWYQTLSRILFPPQNHGPTSPISSWTSCFPSQVPYPCTNLSGSLHCHLYLEHHSVSHSRNMVTQHQNPQ